MRKQRVGKYLGPLLVAISIVIASAHAVSAVTSSSNSYQVTETEFGAGSTQQTCSDQYCAKTSIGDLTSGKSGSVANTASFGPVTPDEPLLEVIINQGESDLGTLTTERTATKTMLVQIRSYLSSGYTLQINGSPPKYGNHTLNTPTTPTASIMGTEQFALNAVANTIPSVGADPVQVPSSEFSFGIVEDDYDTPNLFKYVSGDVVARSTTASGQTDYTITTIVNVSNATPAGHYSGDFSAVVVPVY